MRGRKRWSWMKRDNKISEKRKKGKTVQRRE
jgi:hypothetical protein